MSETNSDYQPNNYQSIDGKNQNFFQRIWKETKRFFIVVGNFFSKNKYKFGFGLGIFAIAGAVTASVFFGPALYTAITGLLPAVIPGLAVITTGLAAAVPFVALAIIAATIVVTFTLGLFIAINSTRSIKAQKELSSEVKSEEQPLNKNQAFDQNKLSDPNQQAPTLTSQSDHSNHDDQSDHSNHDDQSDQSDR